MSQEAAVTLWNAYQALPLEKRICESCARPIASNIALFDGQLWHWGHLKNNERFGIAVAQCLECGSFLSNRFVIRASYDVSGVQLEKNCGHCGSLQLRNLKKMTSQKVSVRSGSNATTTVL